MLVCITSPQKALLCDYPPWWGWSHCRERQVTQLQYNSVHFLQIQYVHMLVVAIFSSPFSAHPVCTHAGMCYIRHPKKHCSVTIHHGEDEVIAWSGKQYNSVHFLQIQYVHMLVVAIFSSPFSAHPVCTHAGSSHLQLTIFCTSSMYTCWYVLHTSPQKHCSVTIHHGEGEVIAGSGKWHNCSIIQFIFCRSSMYTCW